LDKTHLEKGVALVNKCVLAAPKVQKSKAEGEIGFLEFGGNRCTPVAGGSYEGLLLGVPA
jgi:hypothetical protein